MNNILKIKLAILLLIILNSLFLIHRADAATLYFKPASFKMGVGEIARADFLLDSPENVNALEGKIYFPPDVLEIKNISDGNSIVSLWVVRPKLENNSIVFTGAIPGGYQAFAGKIFSIEFLAKKVGQAAFNIEQAQALLNDGNGTAAKLSLKPLSINIVGKPTGLVTPDLEDGEAPEVFKPVIAQSASIFDGKYFLNFATQDKGSGIDHYEVAEKRSYFEPVPDQWTRAESPYLLQDQELRSWIFVKAVDKKGNNRIAILHPTNRPIYQQPLTIVIGVILVLLVLLIVREQIWPTKRSRRR